MSAPSTNSSPAVESGDLGELILQLRDLRQRVSNLEERLGTTVASPKSQVADSLSPARFDLPSNPVPVLGQMILAIAGAVIGVTLLVWGIRTVFRKLRGVHV